MIDGVDCGRAGIFRLDQTNTMSGEGATSAHPIYFFTPLITEESFGVAHFRWLISPTPA